MLLFYVANLFVKSKLIPFSNYPITSIYNFSKESEMEMTVYIYIYEIR